MVFVEEVIHSMTDFLRCSIIHPSGVLTLCIKKAPAISGRGFAWFVHDNGLRLELGLEVGDGLLHGADRRLGERFVAGDGFGDFRVLVSGEDLELGLEAADGLDGDVHPTRRHLRRNA